VRFYEFEEINEAVADTRSGATVKPILRVSRGHELGVVARARVRV